MFIIVFIKLVMNSSMTFLRIKLFLMLGLIYSVTQVSMKLLVSSDKEDNTLNIYKSLIKILNKCYCENLNPLIMSNVTNHQLRDYSSLKYPMSLILMDENFNLNETQSQFTNYYPTSATFVVIVESLDEFDKILKNIYYSVWSIHEPNFILVSLNSCQNVSEVLNILWRGKFLSGIFLCHNDLEDMVQLYTYNPFADRAPHPWIKIKNDQSRTFYQRNYQEDENVCLNLVYDKTKYLDGYKIKAIGIPKPGVIWDNDMDYNISSLTKNLPYFNAQFALNIFQQTNLTVIINYSNSLTLAKHQFLLTSYNPSQHGRGVYTSYPFRQSSSVIMTQKRPFLSAEDKILSYYSFSIILLIITSFSILFFGLMFNKSQPCSSAALDLIRILVSTSIQQSLNRLPLRIYLFGILWLVIILNATFQGHLAKFLTGPERISIESLLDLKNFKYKVYVNAGSFPSVNLTLSEMQQSAEIINNINGYKVVLNNSQTAYITADFRAYGPAFEHQLHVSEPCSFSYQCFLTNLPIIKRINEISSRYAESGLQNYWDKRAIDKFKTNLTNTEELETSPQVRPLNMKDILFMLKFLTIGLGISFVVFLIELTVGNKNRKRKN